jgi:ABC-type hemin transport system ATPase subunit
MMAHPPKICGRSNQEALEYPVISLDLADAETALDLAKQLAKRSGRTVVVRDANQKTLGTFGHAKLNF